MSYCQNNFCVDILIGVMVGSFQGYFFRSVLKYSFQFFTYLIARVLPFDWATIFGFTLGAIVWSIFFLTILLFQPLITVWKTFLLSFVTAFAISALVFKITHAESKKLRW